MGEKKIDPSGFDVVILCGGLGRRIRPMVSDRPKVLAQINGRPFLDILIKYIAGFGFRRFILCSGYMGDTIRSYYRKSGNRTLEIVFSQEESPLGTAGAVKRAQKYLREGTPFMVFNGDSFCKLDLIKFLHFHLAKKAIASIALAKTTKTKGCGTVILRQNGRIASFHEKKNGKPASCFVNAGLYILNKQVLSMIPEGKSFSLEYDLFPSLVGDKFCGYITQEAEFIDIGTPQNYKRAAKFMSGVH